MLQSENVYYIIQTFSPLRFLLIERFAMDEQSGNLTFLSHQVAVSSSTHLLHSVYFLLLDYFCKPERSQLGSSFLNIQKLLKWLSNGTTTIKNPLFTHCDASWCIIWISANLTTSCSLNAPNSRHLSRLFAICINKQLKTCKLTGFHI